MAENIVQSVKGLSKHAKKKLEISASLCTALKSSKQVTGQKIYLRKLFNIEAPQHVPGRAIDR